MNMQTVAIKYYRLTFMISVPTHVYIPTVTVIDRL